MRAAIQALLSEGLTKKDIALRLGISRSLVSYYSGDRRVEALAEALAARGSTEPLPELPPVSAPDPDDPAASSDRSASLAVLREIRDTAGSPAERSKAAVALLQHSAGTVTDWEPAPGDLAAFIAELLARRPELRPVS